MFLKREFYKFGFKLRNGKRRTSKNKDIVRINEEMRSSGRDGQTEVKIVDGFDVPDDIGDVSELAPRAEDSETRVVRLSRRWNRGRR